MDKLLSSLGPVSAVIGAQWGDEGKGKAIDVLSEHFDVIARACGGANAGHTIVVNGKKHVFHLLPAGSLYDKPIFLGSGMVIHVPTLLEEIETLRKDNIDVVPRLHISAGAHIVLDVYKEIDGVMEQRRAEATGGKIGTTKRGIGPAYMEKAARTGLRMGDLAMIFESADGTKELDWRCTLLEKMFGVRADRKAELARLRAAYDLLKNRIVPMTDLLTLLEEGKRILIEGAQAVLLDIDHGTYPYVTSSQTTVAGALQGLGLPPRSLMSSIGVAKAYCTRVGEGAFPTEATGDTGNRLRERGGEYGATTGRPRRCGWLDLRDLVFAARLNGFTCWNITKLDVLDEEKTIPVAVGTDAQGLPIIENLAGWKASTQGIRLFGKLPKNAQRYVEFIEKHTKTPVSLIGTGQGREDMIVR